MEKACFGRPWPHTDVPKKKSRVERCGPYETTPEEPSRWVRCISPSFSGSYVYKISEVRARGTKVSYTFEDFHGKYDSEWFSEVKVKTFFALGKNPPKLGERYDCKVLKNSRLGLGSYRCRTTPVVRIWQIDANHYKFLSWNNLYYVEVSG